MRSSVSEGRIRNEWGRLQRLSSDDPGVVYLCYRTGQLALRLDRPDDDVNRVFLVAVSTPGVGETPMVFYHAIVHRRTDEGRRYRQREHFRHPFPALDWIHETVPDFDLLETVCVNVADDSTGDSTAASG